MTKEELLSLNENALRTSVLIPLFSAMGFNDVSHHHGGAGELGKDITMWKAGDLGERVNFAVVVKCGTISGKAAGKRGAGEVETQVRQCFGSTFKDALTSENCSVQRCWVVASGHISKEALAAIEASLNQTNHLNQTTFINGDKLLELLRQYLPEQSLWDEVEKVRELTKNIDPMFDVSLTVAEQNTTIGLIPKHADVEPPVLGFKCSFPKTAEGEEARKQFEQFLKIGGPLKLTPDQIVEVKLPDVMKKLIGDPEGRHFGFEFTPTPGESLPCMFEAIPAEGEPAVLKLIQLRRTRFGTDEVLLTNEHQKYPALVALSFALEVKRLTIQFRASCVGHNVSQVAEWYRFQRALSGRSKISIRHLENGLELLSQQADQTLPEPEPEVTEMADALEFIQRRTGVLLRWPERISIEEQNRILGIVDVLRTGRITLRRFSLMVARRSLGSDYDKGIRRGPLGLSSPEYHDEVLGSDINLGPVEITGPLGDWSWQPATQNASSTEEGEMQEVTFTPAEGTLVNAEFANWLPDTVA
ncbi:MAG: hypothetical protein M3414_09995 [Pseudomonadota bacterium]|nr:hypothetical protein [Pseudomonadota bacterium]